MNKKIKNFFWFMFFFLLLANIILLFFFILNTPLGPPPIINQIIVYSVLGLDFLFFIIGTFIAIGSNLSRENIFQNFTRAQIFALINRNPGIHFSEIARTLKLGNGQTHWHINVLKHFDFIKITKSRNFITFYPNNELAFEPLEVLNQKSVLKSETRKKIYSEICLIPALTQNELLKKLNISQSTLAYHLAILEQEKLININKKGRIRYYYPQDTTIYQKL